VSQVSSSSWSTGSEGGISSERIRFNYQNTVLIRSTRLHHSWYPPLGWLSR
jgi:hypothetical protein